MKKPSPTQRKVLENAAGIASHRPYGMSQHGGWISAKTACHRNNWLVEHDVITDAGRAAIGLPAQPPQTREVL